jgi:hypothetical protein
MSMERNIVIGALAALFAGFLGYALVHNNFCATGKYYKLCASHNSTPTPGLAGVTVTNSVLSTNPNTNAITFSDGTISIYDQGSTGYGFKVGDCVYNDNTC